MADVEITVGDNISAGIDAKLKAIGTAATEGAASVDQLKAAVNGLSAGGSLDRITLSAKDFAAALAEAGGNLKAITPQMIGEADAANVATNSLRGYTQAQVDLFKAQQAGLNFQKDLNASFAISGKSATESAAAFRELGLSTAEATTGLRGFTAAQVAALRAEQEGAAFLAQLNGRLIENSLANKSAAESASVFAAAQKESSASMSAGTSAALGLGKVLLGLFAFSEIQKATDNYIKLSNALHLAGLQGQAFTDAQNRVIEIAKTNGVAINTLALLYQKLAVAQKILGSSAEQTTSLVEGVSAAIRVQGASTAAAQRATTDLAEIFDTNTVSMRQWRGVLIQVPSIAIAAANGIARFHGDVSALNKAILDHQVSSKELFQGLLVGFKQTEAQAAKTTLTISAAFTNLDTALTQFIADTSQNNIIIGAFTAAIQFLGDNLRFIIPGVILFGAAWATVKLVQLANWIYDVATAERTMAIATALLDGSLVPLIVATFDFTLGVIAGVAALYALIAGVAFATGHLDDFNKWLKTSATSIASFVTNLGQTSKQVPMIDELSKNMANVAEETTATATATTKAAAGFDKLGTAGATSAAKINRSFQVVGNTLDTLLWKMNQTANGATATAQYNDLLKKGGSSGSFQAVPPPTGQSPSFTSLPRPTLGFANGGSFLVGGKSGVDQNIVSFNATKGERVDITTPQQQANRAGGVVYSPRSVSVTIVTPNADSFGRSRKQLGQQMKAIMG